jgi:hypothetical protein
MTDPALESSQTCGIEKWVHKLDHQVMAFAAVKRNKNSCCIGRNGSYCCKTSVKCFAMSQARTAEVTICTSCAALRLPPPVPNCVCRCTHRPITLVSPAWEWSTDKHADERYISGKEVGNWDWMWDETPLCQESKVELSVNCTAGLLQGLPSPVYKAVVTTTVASDEPLTTDHKDFQFVNAYAKLHWSWTSLTFHMLPIWTDLSKSEFGPIKNLFQWKLETSEITHFKETAGMYIDPTMLHRLSNEEVGSSIEINASDRGLFGVGREVTKCTIKAKFNSASRPRLIEIQETLRDRRVRYGSIVLKNGNMENDIITLWLGNILSYIWQLESSCTYKDYYACCVTYAVCQPSDGRYAYSDLIQGFEPCSTALRDRNWFIGSYTDSLNNTPTTPQFVASLAGSLVLWYIMGVRDRHQDNFGTNASQQFVGIDFEFITRDCPGIDTDDWPIPWCVYSKLKNEGPLLEEFCTLVHNSLRAAQKHRSVILAALAEILEHKNVTQAKYMKIMAYVNKRLCQRLSYGTLRRLLYNGPTLMLPKYITHQASQYFWPTVKQTSQVNLDGLV